LTFFGSGFFGAFMCGCVLSRFLNSRAFSSAENFVEGGSGGFEGLSFDGIRVLLSSASAFAALSSALVLIDQSEPDVGRLDSQQSYVVLGGGDCLLKDLHRYFEQAIQSRIVTLSTSIRQLMTLTTRKNYLIQRTV
jgi:hypothetical protein